MHFFGLIGAVLAVLALSADLSFAQQDAYKGWNGRFWAGAAGRYVLSDNDTFEDPTFGTSETSVAGSSFVLGGDVEYMFNKWLGLDFALAWTSFNVDFQHSVGEGVQQDELGVMPLLFALNFHMINNERLDLWAGYQAGYLFFLDDLAFPVPDLGVYTVETSGTFSPRGFNVGADVKWSDEWAVNFAFRYQDGDASDTLFVDPTFITFGFSRKF